MNEKVMYVLAAMTVVFLAILQVCWFLVRTVVGSALYFVFFFTVGWLIGGAISSHEHC